MNRLLTAIVAALMLAGGLSAISGATAMPSPSTVAIVGEGPSPLPILPSSDSHSDVGSPVNQ